MLGFVGMVLATLVSGVMGLATLSLNMRFLARFLVHLQSLCFDRALAYRMDFHDENRRSHLTQLLIAEARACHSYMKELTTAAGNVFRMVVHAAFLVLVSPALTVVFAGIGAAALLVTHRLNRRTEALTKQALARRQDLMAAAQETLYGIRQVKLLVAEVQARRQFLDASQGSAGLLARIAILINGQAALMQMVGLVAVLAIVGVAFAAPGIVAADRVLLFLYIATGMTPAVAAVAREYGIMGEQVESVRDLVRFLAQQPYVERAGMVEWPVLLRDRIVFDRVALDYESRKDVLSDVSLTIRRGERIGVVGPSGSGKTSLVGLIPRLYDPREGAILIDGTDLREFQLPYLRRRVGLLSQDVFVFNTTVAENIRMGRPEATAAEVEAAAKLAHAHEFIAALPQGYDTVVGDRGVKLSGGQRQRVNIAQVFLKDPEILVLDEATSSLDTETERLVQEALDSLAEGRTTIAIAHRLSTVREADQIVVLDHGRVVEVGKHEDLILAAGRYTKLASRDADLELTA
jgi:ABC-type multidrug transport system fused ATPase/permease subunit